MIETASWPPKCATDSSGRRAQDSRPAPAASASPLPDQAIRSRPARPRGLIPGRERGLRSLGDSIGKPSAIFRAHTRILHRTFINNMHPVDRKMLIRQQRFDLRAAALLRPFFRPHLAMTTLALRQSFAAIRWMEDFHLQADQPPLSGPGGMLV